MRQNQNKLPDTSKTARTKKPEHFLSIDMTALILSMDDANLIPEKVFYQPYVPDFPLLGATETEAEKAAFEPFLNRYYPRKKFAELRRRLDLVRGSKLTTPIRVFRKIHETRELFRSTVRVGNWIAETTNTKRPALQICGFGCGRFFLARRKDAKTCSPKCSARARMWRARGKGKIVDYELERQKKLAAKEWDEKVLAIRKKGAAS
jgi:hypothetical protein